MTDDTVELPNDAVEQVIQELETGMRQAETHLNHEEIRPSGHMMAMAFKDAYRELIQAHPEYEYVEGGSDD